MLIFAQLSQMAEAKHMMQLRRFAKGTAGLVFLTALSGTFSLFVSAVSKIYSNYVNAFLC